MNETFNNEELAKLCPCFIQVSDKGRIVNAGPSLIRHLDGKLLTQNFLDYFKVDHPRDITKLEQFWDLKRSLMVKTRNTPSLRLRGCVFPREDHLIFLMGHVPDQQSGGEQGSNLRIADFSPTDGTLDMIMALEMRKNLLSDAQELADKLKLERQVADQANQAKTMFLAFMSHEVRTPLNGILGMADGMVHTQLDDEQSDMIDTIRTSGRALLSVLNDVLDLTKIERGYLEVNEEVFNLTKLLENSASLFRAKAEEKGLGLQVEPAGEWMLGDAGRLRQIINNLIYNAVKFTETGQISVSAQVEPDPKIADCVWVEIAVQDTGVGIPAEDLKTLFEPFKQVSRTKAALMEGTGLGLSISRRLCEMMGGQIEADSEVDVGTTFTIHLPFKGAEKPKSRNPQFEGALIEDGQCILPDPLKVLVAEDNQINQKVIEVLARYLPVKLDIVENGAKAVEAWQANTYDLILMDIQMPVVDGVEATRTIRAREAERDDPAIPIYALTANVMTDQIKEYDASGFTGHLSKPVDVDRLKDVIASTYEAMRDEAG